MVLKGVLEFFVCWWGVYFIPDGERVYKWFLAFLPESPQKSGGRRRNRDGRGPLHDRTGHHVGPMRGYAFGVLFVLHVPSAALLRAGGRF